MELRLIAPKWYLEMKTIRAKNPRNATPAGATSHRNVSKVNYTKMESWLIAPKWHLD